MQISNISLTSVRFQRASIILNSRAKPCKIGSPRPGCRTAGSKDWEAFVGPRPDSKNIALRHPAFRGYADYMQTPPFWHAFDELLDEAAVARTAIMCSETLWWRCHRRLIADAAVLTRGVAVQDLFHDDKLAAHRVTEGARVHGGLVVYDVLSEPSLLEHL